MRPTGDPEEKRAVFTQAAALVAKSAAGTVRAALAEAAAQQPRLLGRTGAPDKAAFKSHLDTAASFEAAAAASTATGV